MSLNQYYVVLMKKGPNWTQNASPELERHQQDHLQQLSELHSAGKLAITGPFEGLSDEPVRAISLFYRKAFSSLDELKELVEENELFKQGHLVAEYGTWFFPEWQTLVPDRPSAISHIHA